MEIYIHNHKTYSLPYEEMKTSFNGFKFTEQEIFGSGKIKRHISGANKYAMISLKINKHKYSNIFTWNVSENQIPVIYFDTVLSTITVPYRKRGLFLNKSKIFLY